MLNREQRLYLLHTLINSIISIRVEGQSHIPKTGGALLICNHTDYIDAIIQGLYSTRNLTFLAKAELLDDDIYTRLQLYRQELQKVGVPDEVMGIIDELINVYSQFLDDVRILPIIRNYRSGRAPSNQEYYNRVLYNAVEIIADGQILAMYPEGCRSPDGKLLDFKTFAARIALHSRMPVVPAAILGAHGTCDPANWITGKNFNRVISYRIGKPLEPKNYPAGSDKQAIKEMTQMMQAAVNDLGN